MACRIDLEIQLYDADTGEQLSGAATCYMGQPPAVGTYFGPIQTLVVREVHYLGLANGIDKDHYAVALMTLSTRRHGYDSCEDIMRTIRQQAPWLTWEFEPTPEETTFDESEDPQDGA